MPARRILPDRIRSGRPLLVRGREYGPAPLTSALGGGNGSPGVIGMPEGKNLPDCLTTLVLTASPIATIHFAGGLSGEHVTDRILPARQAAFCPQRYSMSLV